MVFYLRYHSKGNIRKVLVDIYPNLSLKNASFGWRLLMFFFFLLVIYSRNSAQWDISELVFHWRKNSSLVEFI